MARTATLDTAYAAEQEYVRTVRNERQTVTHILVVVALLGVLLMPFGCLHKAFFIIGLLIAVGFGAWIAVHSAYSPARLIAQRLRSIRRSKDTLRREFKRRVQEIEHHAQTLVKSATEKTRQLEQLKRVPKLPPEAVFREFQRRVQEIEREAQTLVNSATEKTRQLEQLESRPKQAAEAARREFQRRVQEIEREAQTLVNSATEKTRRFGQLEGQPKEAAQAAYRSRCEQEFLIRERRLTDSDAAVQRLTTSWMSRVPLIIQEYQLKHRELSDPISAQVNSCRALATQFATDLQRLTARAESAATLRHLRLHSIFDADLEGIGPTLKQALASNNIVTAADIEEHSVRKVYGFGDARTGCLISWRQSVLKKFRFDAKTAISPAERLTLANSYQNKQQQIIAEMTRRLHTLETLASECKRTIQARVPELQTALDRWDQSKADLDLLRGAKF